MRDKILNEVNEQPFFSISADEAADCSNKEQMSFVVRFVDRNDNIREAFLDFINCDDGTTGQAIADKVLQRMGMFGLCLSKLRGQCYDGAGNMAGRLNGAAALVQKQANKASYFHCAAHALNLCIMATSRIIPVRNMWNVLKEVSLFFSNSPKRQQCFVEILTASKVQESSRKKLIDLCQTLWVARNDALLVFSQLYPVVVDTLTTIRSSNGWNSESSFKALSLLNSITQFCFISTFVVTSKIMSYTAPLAVSL